LQIAVAHEAYEVVRVLVSRHFKPDADTFLNMLQTDLAVESVKAVVDVHPEMFSTNFLKESPMKIAVSAGAYRVAIELYRRIGECHGQADHVKK
jgi:hypothetical protein